MVYDDIFMSSTVCSTLSGVKRTGVCSEQFNLSGLSSGVKNVGGTDCFLDCRADGLSVVKLVALRIAFLPCPAERLSKINWKYYGVSFWLDGDTIGIKDCFCFESSLCFSTFIIIVKFSTTEELRV